MIIKNNHRAIFGWLLFLVAVSSCSKEVDQVQRQNYGRAQGSTYQVSYVAKPGVDYQLSIDSLLISIDMSLSTWKEQSTISKLNRGDTLDMSDQQFMAVMDSSMALFESTAGLFNVTIGRLIDVWGFHKADKAVPSDSAIDWALTTVSWENIYAQSDSMWLSNDILLDVNGIAQGYTVDKIALFLESKGINRYMVEVGGEIRCRGNNIDERIWRVGIDKPIEEVGDDRLQRIISLENKALATSGNYRKYIQDSKTGIKYGHSIDPLTGKPNKDVLLSASVICNNATTADAWGTALMVAGLDRAKELVESHPELEAYLIYSNRKGEWKEWLSPGFPE